MGGREKAIGADLCNDRLNDQLLISLPLKVTKRKPMSHARKEEGGLSVHLIGAGRHHKPRISWVIDIHRNGHGDATYRINERLDAIKVYECHM